MSLASTWFSAQSFTASAGRMGPPTVREMAHNYLVDQLKLAGCVRERDAFCCIHGKRFEVRP